MNIFAREMDFEALWALISEVLNKITIRWPTTGQILGESIG